MNNILCALSLAALLAGTAGAGRDPDASPWAEKGGTLRFTAFQAPKSINYYLDNSVSSGAQFDLMYETLLSIDPATLDFAPSLARAWTVSDDGLSFTFEIDPAARWSDGRPVTAEDVQWTWDAVMDPRNATGPFKVALRLFDRPECPNPQTVVFRARENHWRNLSACGTFHVLPRHVCANRPFELIDFSHPVVSGPYVVDGVKEGIETRMRRRSDWWAAGCERNAGLMNFDCVVWKYFADMENAFEVFKKGELDIFPVYSARMWATGTGGRKFDLNHIVKVKVRNANPAGFQGFAMNMRRAPFDDLRVRKAIAHLVDRPTMIRTLMYGAYHLQTSYCEDLYDAQHPCTNVCFAYSPDEAARLLDEAGWRLDPADGLRKKEGCPLAFTFLTRDTSTDRFLALCDNAFKSAGVTMKLERKDWAAWMRDMDRFDFDMTWAAWGGSLFRDPEAMWASAEADRPSSVNITGFKDAQVDSLIERQKTMMSASARNEVMRQIDARLAAQVPYVLLWYTDSVRLLYWNRFGTPEKILPKYADERAAVTHWWFDAASDEELREAILSDRALPAPR